MVAAGCTRYNVSTDPGIVRFTSSVRDFSVKATDATLSGEDEVGIFATAPISAGNVRGIVSGKFIFPEKDLYWQDGQESATRFSAYYPYSEAVQEETFSFAVAEDQTTFAGYSSSDIRTASVTVSPLNVVNFIFGHRMSKIILAIDPCGRTISDVSIGDVFRGGTVDIVAGEVSDLTDPGCVHAGLSASSQEARAYVAVFMPETVKLDLVIKADGKEFLYTLEEPQEFLSGYAYYASLKLDDAVSPGSTTGFVVSIVNWEDGTPLEFSREQ